MVFFHAGGRTDIDQILCFLSPPPAQSGTAEEPPSQPQQQEASSGAQNGGAEEGGGEGQEDGGGGWGYDDGALPPLPEECGADKHPVVVLRSVYTREESEADPHFFDDLEVWRWCDPQFLFFLST